VWYQADQGVLCCKELSQKFSPWLFPPKHPTKLSYQLLVPIIAIVIDIIVVNTNNSRTTITTTTTNEHN
jgi:hypothetical protein